MTKIMGNLLALQELELQTRSLSLAEEKEILRLREGVPPSVLLYFDRLICRGKKAVAIARDGVCSECHLRVSSGARADLASNSELHTCDNCGRYLYLPVVALPVPESMPNAAVPTCRKTRQPANRGVRAYQSRG